MDDIHKLYYNALGITFQWKRSAVSEINKIQLVFKTNCLSLTIEELLLFSRQIEIALYSSHSFCKDCKHDNLCQAIILQTPIKSLSLALSYKDIFLIQDLVKGTLFEIQLRGLFANLGIKT